MKNPAETQSLRENRSDFSPVLTCGCLVIAPVTEGEVNPSVGTHCVPCEVVACVGLVT